MTVSKTDKEYLSLHLRKFPEILRSCVPGWVTGVEIGVGKGDLTKSVLENVALDHVYCVDPWMFLPDFPDGAGFNACQRIMDDSFLKFISQVVLNYPKKVIPLKMESHSASALFPEKKLDFVFIDGNHTYEYVKQDITDWLPKIQIGGVLAGHDFGHRRFPGVEKAVRELLSDFFFDEDSMVWWHIVKE